MCKNTCLFLINTCYRFLLLHCVKTFLHLTSIGHQTFLFHFDLHSRCNFTDTANFFITVPFFCLCFLLSLSLFLLLTIVIDSISAHPCALETQFLHDAPSLIDHQILTCLSSSNSLSHTSVPFFLSKELMCLKRYGTFRHI